MSQAAPFETTDWGGLLRLALSVGIVPEAFWRLSVREWRMLTRERAGIEPLARAELERMAEVWPDE